MEIAFGILGQTTMHLHGQSTVNWGRRKEREILAVLLVHPRQRISTDLLARWIWADDGQEPLDVASTSRTYATRIGKAMRDTSVPGTIRMIGGALYLDVEQDAIDYFAFGKLINKAREHNRRGDHEATCELINSAFELWRDQPLADLRSQPAAGFRHSAIHNKWLPANQLLLGSQITLGHYEDALHRLDRLQQEHGADLGLTKRRLQVLHALERPEDESGHFLATLKLLQDADEDDAADELRRYHNALISRPTSASTSTSAAGASGAAKRLSSLHAVRKAIDPARSLLPDLPPRGRSQLPAGIADFVGHDDLQATLDELARTSGGGLRPGVVVLDGLAGIGKTSLALHWAHRQLGDLVDNAFYLDLHGFDGGRRKEANEVVDELLDAFDVPIARFTTSAGREAKLREILTGKRTLVVLDDAVNSPHVQPLLFTLSPCLVLVTSRQRLTGLAGRGARHCAVTPLSPGNAVTVLTERIGTRAAAEPRAIARLTALCGGLPLVLQLVAHHIEVCREATLTQFADDLQDQGRLLDISDYGDDPHANLRAALTVTYNNTLSDEAQRVFRLIGLSPAPEVTLHAAAALAGQSIKDTKRSLEMLVSTHFLTHAGALDRYRLHDLLRSFARDLVANEDHHPAETRLLSFYLHTSYRADDKLFPFRTPVPLLRLEPGVPVVDFANEEDAAAWLLQERGNLTAIIPWSARQGHHGYTWRLPHNLYGYFRRNGYYDELCNVFEIAVSSAQALGELEAEGATRNDLGLIYLALNDWRNALGQFHLAAAIAQQTENTAGIAISLSQFGLHEAHMGNLGAAERLHQQALDKVVKTDDLNATSTILHRLAGIYRDQGRHGKSITTYSQALDLKRSLRNLHGQAGTLTEIATTLTEQGLYSAAREFGDEGLRIVQEINDVELEPHVFSVLAEIYLRQADYQRAIEYARQAARLAARIHNSKVEADALHTLGHALYESDQPDAAREEWLRCATVYTDLGSHDRVHHIESDLASLTVKPESLPLPRTHEVDCSNTRQET